MCISQNESRSPQRVVNIIKRKPHTNTRFQILASFHSQQSATIVVAGQRQLLSPAAVESLSAEQGGIMCFRTSSPFLFNIEPNKKPQSEFSRRVNLEDISCVSITDTKSSGGGWATCGKRESDWFGVGGDPKVVSSLSSAASATPAYAPWQHLFGLALVFRRPCTAGALTELYRGFIWLLQWDVLLKPAYSPQHMHPHLEISMMPRESPTHWSCSVALLSHGRSPGLLLETIMDLSARPLPLSQMSVFLIMHDR